MSEFAGFDATIAWKALAAGETESLNSLIESWPQQRYIEDRLAIQAITAAEEKRCGAAKQYIRTLRDQSSSWQLSYARMYVNSACGSEEELRSSVEDVLSSKDLPSHVIVAAIRFALLRGYIRALKRIVAHFRGVNHVPPAVRAARVYLQVSSGNVTSAASLLRNLSGQELHPWEAYAVGILCYRQKHTKDAEVLFQRAKVDEKLCSKSLYYLADIAFQRHRFRKARRIAEEGLNLDPNDLALLSVLFRAELILGRWPSAIKTFRRFRNARRSKMGPDSPDKR